MPFITEEIYTHLPTVEGSIVIAEFPHYTEADNMAKEERNDELNNGWYKKT